MIKIEEDESMNENNQTEEIKKNGSMRITKEKTFKKEKKKKCC